MRAPAEPVKPGRDDLPTRLGYTPDNPLPDGPEDPDPPEGEPMPEPLDLAA